MAECKGPAGWRVDILERVDSTNDELKRRIAGAGAEKLAVIANAQTGGRGRRGRSFQSLAGKGLYLSALFRPRGEPEELAQLTAWTAVAVCRALERVCGVQGEIKWPNDVLSGGKKLCGILTEMVGEWAIPGIGINLTQTEADFGPALRDKAVSLAQLGVFVDRDTLAQALLEELDRLAGDFPQRREDYLAEYRRRCVTLGREVLLVEATGERRATGLDVDEHFALRVRLDTGEERTVSSGEVSVRGLLGYG